MIAGTSKSWLESGMFYLRQDYPFKVSGRAVNHSELQPASQGLSKASEVAVSQLPNAYESDLDQEVTNVL